MPSFTFLPSDVVPSINDSYFTAQLTQHIENLQQTVPAYLRANEVDVYSIAVVYRNTTLYSTGLVDTPFRVGSITKVFAALGALMLRERGILTLEDPVKKFLPKFSVINPYGAHDITLHELMGHLSGLPRELCAGSVCGYEISEEEALEIVAQMETALPPWSFLPIYSNLGFALLGHAWEKATSPRKSWSEFISDEILAPLGMRDTGVDMAGVELASGNINPYPANYSLGWIGPAGDMYSTTPDLAKFLKFLLRPDPKLLSAATNREWTHPTTVFPDACGSGFALPWEIILLNYGNQPSTLITKNGLIGTYSSFLAFHPDTQLGVAVLTSVNTSAQLNAAPAVTLKILEELIPAVQSVHSNFISSLYSGVYVCNHSDTMVSPNLVNTTFQVLGGEINVTTMTADKGLIAHFNVTIVQSGVEARLAGSRSLIFKPCAERHCFWSSPGPCFNMASGLSSDPEISRPNFPGSVYLYAFRFDLEAHVLLWPFIGATCLKSG